MTFALRERRAVIPTVARAIFQQLFKQLFVHLSSDFFCLTGVVAQRPAGSARNTLPIQ